MFQRISALVLFLTAFAPAALASPLVSRADNTTGTCPYPPYPTYRARDLLTARAASAIGFSNSDWIYTNETTDIQNAPLGSRALRKTFVAPEGKTPEYATIIYATDNEGILYVNGDEIADLDFTNRFAAGMYCVKLQSCLNVFAVNATNTGGPAGVLFAAQITYTDGTTSDIVSDTTWRANSGGPPPNGFEQLSFDDSAWPPAISESSYANGLWGTVPIAGVDPLSFNQARWIWTTELSDGTSGNAPPGARAFRKTIFLPAGHTTASATAIITTDNEYSLYINGVFVGTGTDFTVAQRYDISNIQGPKVVFAIYAVNTATVPNPAGVLAAFEITSSDPSLYCVTNCTSTSIVATGEDWKANLGTPTGFQEPDFDDSDWEEAAFEGSNGSQPWGTIAVPTATATPGSPLPSAPASA